MSIKIENVEVMGWEAAIRGMRNPMNSWEKSDSVFSKHVASNTCSLYDVCLNDLPPCNIPEEVHEDNKTGLLYNIGPNDLDLMKRLCKAGTEHRKFMRMIAVYVDITAPLYYFKEFDTYKVGTVANSCSTMHKIHAKEFTLEDFSCEHLSKVSLSVLNTTIEQLNWCRESYLKSKDKGCWWQMIQLLPSSYNQKRTVMLNYEVLAAMYRQRKNHKLDDWREFCSWIETLPCSELITGSKKED